MSKWLKLTECPACKSHDLIDCGKLPEGRYFFGDAIIPFPVDGIRLSECKNCFLYFKTTVPAPDFLEKVFVNQAGNIWDDTYDFTYERKLIDRFIKRKKFDLLDVGPSNGALLKSFSNSNGRRSGLDVVEHPGLNLHLKGELICGLLEDEKLNWSNDPYDVVTAYDVFEHFYDPCKAFVNLRSLLKTNALVVIETGNIASYYPKKYGAHQWWYVNLFEHHIFWQPKTLLHHAQNNGFEIVFMNEVRHKGWRDRAKFYKFKQMVKEVLWTLSPCLYKKIANKLNEQALLPPWSPLKVDHFVTVLRKV